MTVRPPAGRRPQGRRRTGSKVPERSAEQVHEVCVRFHAAVELIGGRWTGAILQAVFTGHHRFGRIRAAVPGLSDTMLAQRLRTLEAHELLERRPAGADQAGSGARAGQAGAGHVEYHLTAKGRELSPVIDAMIVWSHRWIPLPGGGGSS